MGDGAVLPILHLNGYKIANPTVLARIPETELRDLMIGYGYKPYFVTGDDPALVHQQLAATLDTVLDEIRDIQSAARSGKATAGPNGASLRPAWPMIVLRTPKGWTGPKVVDGKQVEGTWRSHQVPLTEVRTNAAHRALLETWMRSYKPEELFDEEGRSLRPELAALAPKGERRMGANPHANGGLLLRELIMPDFRDYAVDVPKPGGSLSEATFVAGTFVRDIMAKNVDNFRMFGPGRDGLQPLPGDLRGDRQGLGRRGDPRRRQGQRSLHRRPGHGGPVRSISAKAGWRATS